MKVTSVLLLVLALTAVTLTQAKIYKSTYKGSLNHRFHQQNHLLAATDAAPAQYFTQNLDHYDQTNTQTFQQKYYVNDSWFVADSNQPVWFILGGEGPTSAAYVSGKFIANKYAEQYGGLVVVLEHRFYGESLPGGVNGPTPATMLKYLSSQQALADTATFHAYFSQQYNLTSGSQWIVFGGSYSGSLSAWAKLKYPHLYKGAISSSAPVQAELDFYQYFEVVQNSVGPSCAARLKAGTTAAETLISTPEGRLKLQGLFNTCTPILDQDVANFFESLSDPIAGIVQYSDDNTAYQPTDVAGACKILEDPSQPDPLLALLNLINFSNAFSNTTGCMDISYANYIASMQATSAGRSWTWQTCIEFGYYQSAETAAQPFSKYITLEWFVQQCTDIFNIKGLTPNIAFTNAYYGAKNIVTENTYFTNGIVDPWHILGLPSSATPGNNCFVTVMEGTAHCADLYSPRAQDLPVLTATRQLQAAAIDLWLRS